jgi:hypothetical protein
MPSASPHTASQQHRQRTSPNDDKAPTFAAEDADQQSQLGDARHANGKDFAQLRRTARKDNQLHLVFHVSTEHPSATLVGSDLNRSLPCTTRLESAGI